MLGIDGVVDLVSSLHAHAGESGADERDLAPSALAALFATVAHAGRVGWAEFKAALHSAAGARVAALGASLAAAAPPRAVR